MMFSQIEMERATLGALLAEGANGPVEIDAADFATQPHRRALQAIREGHRDPPGFVACVGGDGAALFADLTLAACAPANLPHFARMLRRQRQLREIRQRALALAEEATGPLADPGELARGAVERWRGLAEAPDSSLILSLRSLAEVMAEQQLVGAAREVATGMPALDSAAHIGPGSLNVIAARPGGGKSAMLLDWGVRAAEQGFQVLLFSLEMTLRDVRRRLWAMFPEGPERVASLPMWVQEPFARRPAVGHLTAIAAEFCRTLRDRPTLVVVDYCQIVSPNRAWPTRREQVGEVVRELKALAMSLEIPVLAAAQLSRALELRGPRARPQLSDLKEAGEIEEVADLVCLLHRPKAEGTEALLGIAKNRHGPAHLSERLCFLPERARFAPAATQADWQAP